MLRIGFDAKRLFQNFTGLGNYSRSLVSDLQRFFPEHEYHLFTPGIRQHPETIYFLDNPAFRTHQKNGPLKSLWRTFGLPADLKRHRIQVYHGLSHEIPYNIHKTGIKSVVTIHDLAFLAHPNFFPFVDRKIYNAKFKYACKHADRVLAISESTKLDVMRFYGTPEDQIQVIYQTCHPNFWKPVTSENQSATVKKYGLPEHFMLYVGAVIERKNLLNVIKAMELLPESCQTPLVVVGDGKAYLKKVKEYLGGRAIEKQIYFLPKMEFRDLPALYQRASLFLYISFYEGFGIPIIEALCSGTPVITSPYSSLPEAGGPHSRYVEPTDPVAIAEAMEMILSDQTLRKEMVEMGLEYVKRFEAPKVTAGVMQLYQSLV